MVTIDACVDDQPVAWAGRLAGSRAAAANMCQLHWSRINGHHPCAYLKGKH